MYATEDKLFQWSLALITQSGAKSSKMEELRREHSDENCLKDTRIVSYTAVSHKGELQFVPAVSP